jgi:hypothetical protein
LRKGIPGFDIYYAGAIFYPLGKLNNRLFVGKSQEYGRDFTQLDIRNTRYEIRGCY